MDPCALEVDIAVRKVVILTVNEIAAVIVMMIMLCPLSLISGNCVFKWLAEMFLTWNISQLRVRLSYE